MPDHTAITLGEVYRLLQTQSVDLAEIKRDVKAQNGTVSGHETRITVLEERVPGSGGKQGAVAGGIVAAVAVAIELLRQFRP